MKALEVQTDLDVGEIDKILQDFGFEKGEDFHGVSAKEGNKIIHLNDDFEDEETVRKLLRYKFMPNIELIWGNFREHYKKTEDLEERISLMAQYLGLERPPTKELVSFEIPKDNLNRVERDTMENRLASLGIPFGFTVEDGEVRIVFQKQVPKDLKQELEHLVDLWLSPNEKVELNWDFDSENPRRIKNAIEDLSERFGKENLQIRYSANKKIHLRIKGELFEPEEALKIRKETGDDVKRTKRDERKLERGLRPGFLYDYKHGKPAEDWMSIDEFKEMVEWN